MKRFYLIGVAVTIGSAAVMFAPNSYGNSYGKELPSGNGQRVSTPCLDSAVENCPHGEVRSPVLASINKMLSSSQGTPGSALDK